MNSVKLYHIVCAGTDLVLVLYQMKECMYTYKVEHSILHVAYWRLSVPQAVFRQDGALPIR